MLHQKLRRTPQSLMSWNGGFRNDGDRERARPGGAERR
jgi:hypothetical protein